MSHSTSIPCSLHETTRVTRLDESTYSAHLSPAYCIGTVPNGGYVASIFLHAAKAYMAARGQPDALAVHWQFLGRTRAGPAVIRIAEAKTGRAVSVLHMTLHQSRDSSSAGRSRMGGASQGPEVAAYVTQVGLVLFVYVYKV
ncbi:thioesterase family protein [Ophiocordyceps sinensis CO18]|uniref:Thioesterase family protein n=1 Tax=Ophiocordyceps sinensis (strain Co18 / CGMCC 3.14243) TaxID=911162 RepID=T5AHD4_OPHSC|nr:thioesterase family protein [Ophiocordyceps sinensis CO18]